MHDELGAGEIFLQERLQVRLMANHNVVFENGGDLSKNFARAMEKLGGLKSCLKENQPAIVAISMPFPEPAPVTTSFALLGEVLKELKAMNLPRIQVCGVPDWGLDAQKVAQVLGLADFVRQFGAEFTVITQAGNAVPANSSVKYPLNSLISTAPNYISLPSVRFDPILGFIGACGINFQFLLDAQKYASGKMTDCEKNPEAIHEKFVDAILGSLTSRIPDLTVIDGSNLLVGQGPLLLTGGRPYSENFVLAGNNPLALDKQLAEMLGFKMDETLLLKKIAPVGLVDLETRRDPSTVVPVFRSKNPPPLKAKPSLVNPLPSRLHVAQGQTCVLCQRNLRLIADLFTVMGEKDMNSIEELNFLAGISPPPPTSNKNICLFGNCAIQSTTKYDFRQIIHVKVTKKGTDKVVIKRNKSIVELLGCPPLPMDAIHRLIKRLSGKNMPSLSFWMQTWADLKWKQTLPKEWKGEGSA